MRGPGRGGVEFVAPTPADLPRLAALARAYYAESGMPWREAAQGRALAMLCGGDMLALGWLAGYGLAAWVTSGMETDLYRVPLVVNRDTYAKSAIVAILSTAASAVLMNWRIARMDLIAVLKTRE